MELQGIGLYAPNFVLKLLRHNVFQRYPAEASFFGQAHSQLRKHVSAVCVIHNNGRKVLYGQTAYSLRPEFRISDDLRRRDMPCQQRSGSARRPKVDASVLLERGAQFLISLSLTHTGGKAEGIEPGRIGIHAIGCGRASRTNGHAGRRGGGADIVNNCAIQIERQRRASVQRLDHAAVGHITGSVNDAG